MLYVTPLIHLSGATPQNCSGDPEVGAHVRGVHFKAETEQHGEGQV